MDYNEPDMIGKSFKITGDGARHTFSQALAAFLGVPETSGGFQCKWLQITTPPTNGNVAFIGGAEVANGVGYEIPVGWSGQFLPPISELSSRYLLNQEYYFLSANDVIYCLYGID